MQQTEKSSRLHLTMVSECCCVRLEQICESFDFPCQLMVPQREPNERVTVTLARLMRDLSDQNRSELPIKARFVKCAYTSPIPHLDWDT